MSEKKLDEFFRIFTFVFKDIAKKTLDINFDISEKNEYLPTTMIAIVIGITGSNKGRIIFKCDEESAKAIAEKFMGEEAKDLNEILFCLSEFTNIFCGNSITKINNQFRGLELRLTPPVIFEGEGLSIITPNISSADLVFSSDDIKVALNTGFEGV